MVFSFLPQRFGTFIESFRFHVEKFGLTTDFRFVGTARKPRVYLSTSYLILKPTVITVDAAGMITLKNDENLNLCFQFKGKFLYSARRTLIIDPVKGELGPHSERSIR